MLDRWVARPARVLPQCCDCVRVDVRCRELARKLSWGGGGSDAGGLAAADVDAGGTKREDVDADRGADAGAPSRRKETERQSVR